MYFNLIILPIFLMLKLTSVIFSFQDIPIEELIKGDFKSSFRTMKWFKVFYTANVVNEEYDPVKARGGLDISLLETSGACNLHCLEGLFVQYWCNKMFIFSLFFL